MTADQDHMFFLRPTSSSRVLEMTALPLPADTSLTRTVEESLCDTCVSAPEIQRVMCRQCARAPVIRKGKARKVSVKPRFSMGELLSSISHMYIWQTSLWEVEKPEHRQLLLCCKTSAK